MGVMKNANLTSQLNLKYAAWVNQVDGVQPDLGRALGNFSRPNDAWE